MIKKHSASKDWVVPALEVPRKIELVLVILSFSAGAEKKAVLWAGRLLTKMSIFASYLTTIISIG